MQPSIIRPISPPAVIMGAVFSIIGFIPLIKGSLAPDVLMLFPFGVIGLGSILIGLGRETYGGRVLLAGSILFVLVLHYFAFMAPGSTPLGHSHYSGGAISLRYARPGFMAIAIFLDVLAGAALFFRRKFNGDL